jgi:glycosyltransferase involved in cell wall biosynthesis
MPPRRRLLTTDSVGGVWTYSLELARGLAALGTDVVLVTMGPPPTSAQIDELTAIPGVLPVITSLPLDWLAASEDEMLAAGDALAGIVADAVADLGVESVQLHAPALAARADFDVPVISVLHSCVATWWAAMRSGAMPRDLAWRARLTVQGIARSDHVVAPTAAFAAAVQAAYDLPRPPIAVHNGRRLGRPIEAPQRDAVFTAGRLWDESKGAALFDAAAGLSRTPFLAAGALQGPNGTRLQLLHAQALGYLDHDALADLLASRPLFISAGRYEPFGLAVLEAAGAGCALILSDILTFRELWDGAAQFVPVDDPQALAKAADALMADPAQRQALGRAAAAQAARYTPERNAKAMAAVHDSLASVRSRRAA